MPSKIPTRQRRIKGRRGLSSRCARFQGGSVRSSPAQLCRLWAALRLGRLPWPWWRAWWALAEGQVQAEFPGAVPAHAFAARLLGGRWTPRGVEAVQGGLARLGLVHVAGVDQVDDVVLDAESARTAAALGYDNIRGCLKIPRRHARWMARHGKPSRALAATWLAHVLRGCLAKRARRSWWTQYRAVPDFRGCARARWISGTFGVAERRVHGARQRLVRAGLFVEVRTAAYVRRWHGSWLVVAAGPVAESRADTGRAQSMSSNVTPPVQPRRAPLFFQDQGARAPGIKKRDGPDWHAIRRVDLQDPARRWHLHKSAVAAGAIDGTDSARDRFFASVARALRVATRSAPAFLRRIVESPACWRYLAGLDEEAGKVLLGDSWEAADPPVHPRVAPRVAALVGSVPAADPDDSQAEGDWQLVGQLRRHLEAAGVSPMADRWAILMREPLARRLLVGWDRDRWDRACAWIDKPGAGAVDGGEIFDQGP